MGTKRAYEEDLQGFIKHPKHLDYATKTASVTDTKYSLDTVQVVGIPGENDISVPDVVIKELEINEPLPLVTGIDTTEDDSGPGPMFSSNLFSELFEYNIPRRPLFHYEDIYSSVFNKPPRKEIPIGPNHQADVPEFDPETARIYRRDRETERLSGVCVVPICNSMFDNLKLECKCFDRGSIRCVRVHVTEARFRLKECYGDEKFRELGMVEMGEEVASGWSEEEERVYRAVVYSNPGMFWEKLSGVFPCRTKRELVSYYFNVFVLRRRAVQNRARFLDVDSDDDEWCGGYEAGFGGGVDDGDFVVGGYGSFSEDVADIEEISGCFENGKEVV